MRWRLHRDVSGGAVSSRRSSRRLLGACRISILIRWSGSGATDGDRIPCVLVDAFPTEDTIGVYTAGMGSMVAMATVPHVHLRHERDKEAGNKL